MGIHDRHTTFSIDQVVTSTAISTDVSNSEPLFGSNTGVDLGTGYAMDLVVVCTADMTDSGTDSTVTVTLESDSTADLATSATTHLTLPVFDAGDLAGTFRRARLPPGQDWEQFVGLRYTVANGDLDTGSFTAYITPAASIPNTAGKYDSALNFGTLTP